MNAKRGFVPEDERNFSPSALETLRTASLHVGYLINEGYDLKQATTFVGNHFLLSERQRLAIMRSLATNEQLAIRKQKELPTAKASGSEVYIDGFNTIITLEVLTVSSCSGGSDNRAQDTEGLADDEGSINLAEGYRRAPLSHKVFSHSGKGAVALC